MTLVELLISMAILLLVATLCFPKDNIDKYLINSFTKQLSSDIRYVRRTNILEDSSTYITYIKEEGKQGYCINQKGKFIKKVYLPKDSSITHNMGDNRIRFLADGSPYPTGGTVKVNNSNKSKEITIVPVSGRVLLKEGKYEK